MTAATARLPIQGLTGQPAGPLVSIVMALYKTRAEHLHMALCSALSQTHQNIEVIVADDSPDDRLRPLVASWGDRRVSYRHNRPALGVAVNHWRSLRVARGEFVVILNHDDWLAPVFLEFTLQALRQHEEAALAFCDHWVIDAQGHRQASQTERVSSQWGRSRLAPGLHTHLAPLVVSQTIPMAMGTLFRSSALPFDLPDDIGPAYDLWLVYGIARSGAAGVYLPDRLSAWRDHSSSLTHAAGLDLLAGSARCWEAMAHDAAFAAFHPQLMDKAAGAWVSCARAAWQCRQHRQTRIAALRALKMRPSARALMTLGLGLVPSPGDTATRSARADSAAAAQLR